MKIRRRIHFLVYNKLETTPPPLTNIELSSISTSSIPPELIEINKLFRSNTPPHTSTSHDICEDIIEFYHQKISYHVDYIPSNEAETMIVYIFYNSYC